MKGEGRKERKEEREEKEEKKIIFVLMTGQSIIKETWWMVGMSLSRARTKTRGGGGGIHRGISARFSISIFS